MSCLPSPPRAIHITIYNIKSKVDKVYLDNLKSTNSNKKKKWVDIHISKNTLKCKDDVAKFRIFSGHDIISRK